MAAPPIDNRHKPHFHRVAAIKEVCRVATTANINISTALNNGDTIDGVTLATGDRVLVKDQSTGSQNGIYEAAATPVRAYDFSTDDPRVQGCIVPVAAGTVNASTVWQCTNTSAPTIGSTSVAFSDITGGGDFELNIEGGQSVISAHGSMGATETFDPTDGNVHTGTLNANCTFTLSAPTGSGAATLELYLTQDGTGSRTVTWPGSVVWPGGSAPTLSTAAASVDRIILETLDGGTVWYGIMVGGVSYATPAIVLGTAAAAGAAATVIRSDSTIVAFDATVPTTIAASDTAATGSAAFAARRDHRHGAPALVTGRLMIADSHSTPMVFADLLQTEDASDFLYSDT